MSGPCFGEENPYKVVSEGLVTLMSWDPKNFLICLMFVG